MTCWTASYRVLLAVGLGVQGCGGTAPPPAAPPGVYDGPSTPANPSREACESVFRNCGGSGGSDSYCYGRFQECLRQANASGGGDAGSTDATVAPD